MAEGYESAGRPGPAVAGGVRRGMFVTPGAQGNNWPPSTAMSLPYYGALWSPEAKKKLGIKEEYLQN